MDLGGSLWGPAPMPACRIESLVTGLPPGGALGRAMYPDTVGAGWGNVEELLATLAQLLDVGNRQFIAAHVKKGARLPRPIAIPRPWERGREKRPPTQGELKALLGPGPIVVAGGKE